MTKLLERLNEASSVTDFEFAQPDANCVLYIPGLPGSGSLIYGRSTYGNRGTITGAIWGRLPSGLWYLHFDGTDDNILLGTNGLAITDNLTLEAWVNADSFPASPHYSYIITGRSDKYDLYFADASAKPRFYFDCTGGVVADESADDISMGVWHHLRATYNSINGGAIYVDGVLKKTKAANGTIKTAASFYIGNDGGAATNTCLDGKIALPRIYNSMVADHFQQERHLFNV